MKSDFKSRIPVRAILFDFDGTISTLRCGWERVMAPLFVSVLAECGGDPEVIKRKVADYIRDSAGIQTVAQMRWLQEQVRLAGRQPEDVWAYKDRYNTMLMQQVEARLQEVEAGTHDAEHYRMAGAVQFLQALKDKGVRLFLASGTDHPDVMRESAALGVAPYFETVQGAPVRAEACSKEAVMTMLLQEKGFAGNELAVIGDGKVEIALGVRMGARTVGLASDERNRRGIDPVKLERLQKAGAAYLCGDFTDMHGIFSYLGLEE